MPDDKGINRIENLVGIVEGWETPVCPNCGAKGSLREATWVLGTNFVVAIEHDNGRVKSAEYDGEWDDLGWMETRRGLLMCDSCNYDETITDETHLESLQKWLPTKSNEQED